MKKLQVLFILFGFISCSSTSQIDDTNYPPKSQNNFKNICMEDSTSFKIYPEFMINSFDGIFNEISTRNRPVKGDWETDIDFANRVNLFLNQKEDKIIKKLDMNIDFPCRHDNMHNEVCYDVNTSSIQIIFKNYTNFKRVFKINSEIRFDDKHSLAQFTKQHQQIREKVEDRLEFNNLINREIIVPFSSDKMRLNFDDYSFYILFEVDMLKDHNSSYQTSSDWGRAFTTYTKYRNLEVNFVGFSLEKEGEIVLQSTCLQ
jgi:hypothetical protein